MAVLLSVGSCAEAKSDEVIFAMDTYMTLTAYGSGAKDAVKKAKETIEDCDGRWDVSDGESEISKYNETGAELSGDTASLLAFCDEMTDMTGGAFDCHLLTLSRLWGFGTDNERVPGKAEIDGALKDRTKVDLGGVAKGALAAKLRGIFAENGVTRAVCSLGGNVLLVGDNGGRPWNVGIRHPLDSERIIGTVKVSDTSVVTSGGYERYFERGGVRYHHILDPVTGYPSDSGIISATIVSEDDRLADALSTAVYVMGVEKALEYREKHGGFDMILVTDGEVYVTGSLDLELSDSEFTLIHK